MRIDVTPERVLRVRVAPYDQWERESLMRTLTYAQRGASAWMEFAAREDPHTIAFYWFKGIRCKGKSRKWARRRNKARLKRTEGWAEDRIVEQGPHWTRNPWVRHFHEQVVAAGEEGLVIEIPGRSMVV